MIWKPGPPSDARLAVLSYHSWETEPETLIADIRAARAAGWRFVTAAEAVAFVEGRYAGAGSRLALVTTDDGHVEDADFREALAREHCPGVTFVNVGRMAPERFAWYRDAHSAEWAVEDHSARHRRHFVSGHITDVVHGQKLGGLDCLALPIGAPVLTSAGELSAPRFDPHPEVIAVAAEWARGRDRHVLASARWLEELSQRLVAERLAYRWRGRTYVDGTLETQEAFELRVRREVNEGRAAFAAALGRGPTMFAYPWWQGNAVTDRELSEHGYVLTFAGTDRVQGPGMSRYSIPRVVMDPKTPRPIALERLDERSRRDWTAFRRGFERAAKRIMGVV